MFVELFERNVMSRWLCLHKRNIAIQTLSAPDYLDCMQEVRAATACWS